MSPVTRHTRFTRLIAYWAPPVLWMLFISWMSTPTFSSDNTSRIIEPILRYMHPSITDQEVKTYHAVIRKMAHCVEYFMLGMLLFRAFMAGSIARRIEKWAAYSFLAIVLYASMDEIHQYFLPERTASLIDVGIDALGGLLGLCSSVLRYLHRERRQSRF